jgi:hypothetical protein
MGLVCKGLCISLSHYAASWPFLANTIAVSDGGYDGGAHFMLNFHGKLANTGDTPISQSSMHHGAVFIFSTIWPLITYMAYFGSNIWKNMAMLAYFHSTSAAFMSHKIPRGGPLSSLALLTNSRPDVFNRPVSFIRDTPSPEDVRAAIKQTHDANSATHKLYGGGPKSSATLKIGTASYISVEDAEIYANVFLDIMKTYLTIWRRPVIADAFDILRPSSNHSVAWSAAVIMNSWSVEPCIPSLRSMHGFDVAEMLFLAEKVMCSTSVTRGLLPYDAGVEKKLSHQDSTHKTRFEKIAELLKPTIEGFLYAYQTRTYGPGVGEFGCLGLDQYRPNTFDDDTIQFLNAMDKYFFKALTTELGINESQLQGATRFYVYKKQGRG